MNTYTLRLFFNGQRLYQDQAFLAFSPTHAFALATTEAKTQGASHFNVNLGAPDPVED